MKSLAFIVVGLTVGILLMFVLMNSGFLINPQKSTNTLNEKLLVQNIPSPVPSPSSNTIKIEHKNPYFVSYEVTIPSSWTSKTEDNYSKDLTLSNEDYQIVIKQAESEGSLCTYPGDPETEIIFKQNYPYYKAITTSDGTLLRRSGESANANSYTVCGKGSENNFQLPIIYGYTNIKTPNNPMFVMLGEIDQILSSLKKI